MGLQLCHSLLAAGIFRPFLLAGRQSVYDSSVYLQSVLVFLKQGCPFAQFRQATARFPRAGDHLCPPC